MANHGMLTQAKLHEAVLEALEGRNEKRVAQLSPRINWMGQYRRDITEPGLGGSDGHSLLGALRPSEEELCSGKSIDEWVAFCASALESMVSCGFRALDDTQLLPLLEDHPQLAAPLTRVSAAYELTSDGGETVLHWAVSEGPSLELIEAALHEEADPNAQDENCRTPLHWLWSDATSKNDMRLHAYAWVSATRLLVQAGGDAAIIDAEGVSARTLIEGCINEGIFSKQHSQQLLEMTEPAKPGRGRKARA